MTYDFNSLESDDLLGSDFDTEPTEAPITPETSPEVTPDAQEGEITPPPQADVAPAPVIPAPEALDVPGGNAAGAFKAYRSEIATLKAELAQFQQQQEQARAEAEAAQFAAQIEDLALTDPEQAAALIQQRQIQTAQALQQQYETQRVAERAAMSVEYARQAYPDFDAVVTAFQQSPLASKVDWSSFDKEPNPGKALYEFAKSVAPVDTAAMKAELLAELKQQLTPAKPQAPNLLGNLPAAAPNEGGLDFDNLTSRDYQRHGLNLLDHLPG